MGRHIIFKIKNEGIYFNSTERFGWEKTNFPSKEKFGFRENKEIFFEMEMLGYDKNAGTLLVEISNYEAMLPASMESQKLKAPVKKIIFKSVSWKKLQPLLSHYVLQDMEAFEASSQSILTRTEAASAETPAHPSGTHFKFKIPVNKLRFKMGYVEFEKKFKEVEEPVSLKLYNDFILPEFDHIKPFFAKALGSRSIEVSGYLELGDMVIAECKSPEIERINEALIATVRQIRFRKTVKAPKVVAVDKNLFTSDTLFDEFDKADEMGNTLRMSEKEILKSILEIQGIRNKKQLAFLAGSLHEPDEKLRYTLSPDFGFLFYVQGVQMDHFIWELLNTNATYIWSFWKEEMTLAQKFQKVEEILNFIRNHGRMEYLQNHQEDRLVFHRIVHEQADSDLIDSFPKWRARLIEKLI